MSNRRSAFTLFELILAIALSAALLALIGMAINLYLKRVDISRTRVEEAQLARSILTMIADDLRAAAIYQPQDTSSIAQLMAASSPFDVDSIDAERSGSSGGSGGTGGSGSTSGSLGTNSGSLGSSSAASGSSSSSSGSSGSSQQNAVEEEMPLGVSGMVADLYVDVQRLPRGDELFSTFTGYTNAPAAISNGITPTAMGAQSAMLPRPSDLKTVRYFVREGARSVNGVVATPLSPEAQAQAGGLVRQEIPRAARLMAEEMSNSDILQSGQVLIAPEVVHIEFTYYDGEQTTNLWDMAELQQLPLAVEVRIWLASSEALTLAGGTTYDMNDLMSTAREYRQTVFLPMAELSRSGASAAASSSSGSSSSNSSSSSSSSSNGSSLGSSSLGSGSGQQ